MQKYFDITQCGKVIGQASVTQEGLYYCFHCVCTIQDDNFHRLSLQHAKGITDLGLLVPEKGRFVLNKRIPMKQAAKGEWRIFVDARQENKEDALISVQENHPFLFLPQLQNAFFILRNNKPYIQIKDQCPDPQDSDQNQKSLNKWELH